MLEAFGNHAQRESLDLRHSLAAVSAVAEHAWQRGHFCEPATIIFPLELNGEGHNTTLHPVGCPASA